jgi:bifunctional DNA-binding transcriptional regulator/antitoxin component of YhaV-PrlF toxin-antitoxin module
MRALEFKSKIKNNQITIPARIHSALKLDQNKDVRVIVFVDDSEIYDSKLFKNTSSNQFLKGYAESDSIYDNY